MSDDIEFDADPMLFLQTVVDDQIALVEAIEIAGDPFGGVADVARRKIAEAQADLDRMIKADKTWRPA